MVVPLKRRATLQRARKGTSRKDIEALARNYYVAHLVNAPRPFDAPRGESPNQCVGNAPHADYSDRFWLHLSDAGDVCDADCGRDDHSSGMGGDTFVRNDKHRTAGPNSYESDRDNGCASTNDENQSFDATRSENCARA